MKKEKEYMNHIKESWDFACNTSKDIYGENNLGYDLALVVFEKTVSPYHYFIKDNSEQELEEKPTDKQIGLAKKLGIEKPESYTKRTISEAIEEAMKKEK